MVSNGVDSDVEADHTDEEVQPGEQETNDQETEVHKFNCFIGEFLSKIYLLSFVLSIS